MWQNPPTSITCQPALDLLPPRQSHGNAISLQRGAKLNQPIPMLLHLQTMLRLYAGRVINLSLVTARRALWVSSSQVWVTPSVPSARLMPTPPKAGLHVYATRATLVSVPRLVQLAL
jgi:hypothetical protein